MSNFITVQKQIINLDKVLTITKKVTFTRFIISFKINFFYTLKFDCSHDEGITIWRKINKRLGSELF